AGQGIVSDWDAGVRSSPGFLKKFSTNGVLAWERSLDDRLDRHFESIGLSTHEGVLYVASAVSEKNCTLSEDEGAQCDHDGSPYEGELVLQAFDLNGDEVSTLVIEAESNVTGVSRVVVASDGHFYLAVTRVVLVRLEECDTLPETDPWYEYYCGSGFPSLEPSVIELDAAGALIAEHRLENLDAVLDLDVAGDTVYALTQSYEDGDANKVRVFGFTAGGMQLFDQELELGGNVQQMAASS